MVVAEVEVGEEAAMEEEEEEEEGTARTSQPVRGTPITQGEGEAAMGWCLTRVTQSGVAPGRRRGKGAGVQGATETGMGIGTGGDKKGVGVGSVIVIQIVIGETGIEIGTETEIGAGMIAMITEVGEMKIATETGIEIGSDTEQQKNKSHGHE